MHLFALTFLCPPAVFYVCYSIPAYVPLCLQSCFPASFLRPLLNVIKLCRSSLPMLSCCSPTSASRCLGLFPALQPCQSASSVSQSAPTIVSVLCFHSLLTAYSISRSCIFRSHPLPLALTLRSVPSPPTTKS